MNATWQIQTAKNKFCEVIERALHDGPQEITRRGRKTAVVLSFKDFQNMRRRKSPIVKFFQDCPVHDISFDRERDFPREVSL